MSDNKDITKAVDKLVMGVIIGGAVGSVLGMAFSPKTGKQNRKMVKDKVDNLIEEHGEEIESAKKSFFSFLNMNSQSKKKGKKSHE